MNTLEQLKQQSIVVADSGDFQSVMQFKPQDATTNPSLILKAAKLQQYAPLVAEAIQYGKRSELDTEDAIELSMDKLAVLFGGELVKLVPGYVSTEVDASLSFNTEATVNKARKLIALYKEQGSDAQSILIKIAATWEGIQAAKILEAEGIKCNLTLIFNFQQAVASAQANAFLISPFVGRILDWYKKQLDFDAEEHADPGVASVKRIYHYFKSKGHKTLIMAASFRSIEQIIDLAGCDRLTISPQLLAELENSAKIIGRPIGQQDHIDEDLVDISEASFRWSLNEDLMANEKLSEGIRLFNKDQQALKQMLSELW